jgi:hypothetical protein
VSPRRAAQRRSLDGLINRAYPTSRTRQRRDCGHDGRLLETPLSGRELFRVRWPEVREIRAYKRDLLATDLICLGFRDTETDEYFEVHEEMTGFDLLRTRLAEVFPTIPSGWFEDVMHPAFATNLMVLFRREG